MTNPSKPWDAALVRRWLECRFEASRLDQAAADRRGYEARDDFDKAAAEEWSCRALKGADRSNDQVAFAALLRSHEEWRPARAVTELVTKIVGDQS